MIKTVHFAVCDRCGNEGPACCNLDPDLGYDAAEDAASDAGWVLNVDGEDFCPNCKEEQG